MHIFTNSEIESRAEDLGDGRKRYVAELGPDDVAPCVSSTKYVFVGPGTIEYTIWADGGWDAKPSPNLRTRDI